MVRIYKDRNAKFKIAEVGKILNDRNHKFVNHGVRSDKEKEKLKNEIVVVGRIMKKRNRKLETVQVGRMLIEKYPKI